VREIRLGTFSPSVLLEVARASGDMAAAGLAVTEVPATSSPQQFTDLFAGRLDAALTNPDNVVAYRHVPTNPLRRTGDVRILAGVDRGLGLSLFTGPHVPDLEAVRRGVVGVDVRGSGFAHICFELLARAGLRADEDYTVQALGATPRRAAALLEGTCAATILNAGNELRAEERGAHRIASVTEIGPYAGSVLAATGAAVQSNRDVLRDLLEVLVATTRTIREGTASTLIAEAIERRLGLTGAAAAAHLAVLVDDAVGLVPDGRVSRVELETVVHLRERHAPGTALQLGDLLDAGLLDECLLDECLLD